MPPAGGYGAGFSAADVPGVGIRQPGKVVISNRGRTITAYRFFGNIREALFSGSSNLSTELGVDLASDARWTDAVRRTRSSER